MLQLIADVGFADADGNRIAPQDVEEAYANSTWREFPSEVARIVQVHESHVYLYSLVTLAKHYEHSTYGDGEGLDGSWYAAVGSQLIPVVFRSERAVFDDNDYANPRVSIVAEGDVTLASFHVRIDGRA